MPLLRPLHPGQHIAGYELGDCLAEGALVSTWKATENSTGVRVALKTIPLASLDDPDTEDALLEEATLAKNFRDPGVVPLLAFGRDAGVLFVAYGWVDGVELDGLLQQTAERGPLPREIALRLLVDFCSTLAAIHGAGLVHQAVAPGNMMIGADGHLKLLGLGVGVLNRSSSATTFRHMVGKFSYLSPEQLWSRPVDRASDVFSAGLIAFELLTGKHPFRGRNDRETTAKILAPTEAQPAAELVALPPAIDACILRALRKNPPDRFPSAAGMQAALLDALQHTQALASSADVAELCRSWIQVEMTPAAPPSGALPPPSSAAFSGAATQELPALRLEPSPPRWAWVLVAGLVCAGGGLAWWVLR